MTMNQVSSNLSPLLFQYWLFTFIFGIRVLLFEIFSPFPSFTLIRSLLFMLCWLGFQMVSLVFKGASCKISFWCSEFGPSRLILGFGKGNLSMCLLLRFCLYSILGFFFRILTLWLTIMCFTAVKFLVKTQEQFRFSHGPVGATSMGICCRLIQIQWSGGW